MRFPSIKRPNFTLGYICLDFNSVEMSYFEIRTNAEEDDVTKWTL